MAENTTEKNDNLQVEFEKATKSKDERTIKAATAQLELKRAGLLEGKIDGVFGEATRTALGKVTADNTNPALSAAVGALDAKTYNQDNQTAINGAKSKVTAKGETPSAPAPAATKVDAQAERIAKIKAAQTELAKAGFYGDAAKERPESAATGKIEILTNFAMQTAEDAIVKETAQSEECPAHLKEAAKATETLKEIQKMDAKQQANTVKSANEAQKMKVSTAAMVVIGVKRIANETKRSDSRTDSNDQSNDNPKSSNSKPKPAAQQELRKTNESPRFDELGELVREFASQSPTPKGGRTKIEVPSKDEEVCLFGPGLPLTSRWCIKVTPVKTDTPNSPGGGNGAGPGGGKDGGPAGG